MGLPDPIVKVTITGEAITMEAIDEYTYEKCYFSTYEVGEPLVNPRKTKIVKLDNYGKNVYDYFKQLVSAEGYLSIPQSK